MKCFLFKANEKLCNKFSLKAENRLIRPIEKNSSTRLLKKEKLCLPFILLTFKELLEYICVLNKDANSFCFLRS